MPKINKSAASFLDQPKFHPEIEKRADFAKDMIGKGDFALLDAVIRKDQNSDFGKHDAALMLLSLINPETGEYSEAPELLFTTICSSSVVVDQVRKLIEGKRLPVLITPVKVKSANRQEYFSLIPPDDPKETQSTGETPAAR